MIMQSIARRVREVSALACLIATCVCLPAHAQDASGSEDSPPPQQSAPNNDQAAATGPAFRPTAVGENTTATPYSVQDLLEAQRGLLDRSPRAVAPPTPGEFEDYVARLIGRRLPRFGQNLILPEQRDFAAPATAAIPADYILNVGDTVEISLTGAISGTLERTIDNTGRIFLPSVGPISLAGVRSGDLREHVRRAVAGQYREFTVTVAMKELRGIRVYVTGFANNPGAFTVSGLSTLANAVFQAGGPSAGGSFRSVKVYRAGRQVADFDLYQLLRNGNRVNDLVLQNEDVLFIPPAGEQVAVIGSVQHEAIYEIRPGETLEAVLQMAGGINVLGDPDRLVVYNMHDPAVAGPQTVARADAARTAAEGGDIVQILSEGSLQQPVARQSVVVRIEGEVNRPGNYFLPPNTPISEVVAAAGGMTDRAYPFGAKLERQSIRTQQKESYDEALRQLEFLLASAPLSSVLGTDAGQRATQAASARELLEQLRRREPDGRLVMLIEPSATQLPSTVLLENNDRIVIPPRPTVVGVFGAVYRQGSFLLDGQPMRVEDYIERAGGVQRAADKSNIFVVRANGEVLTRKKGALKAYVLAGDVVFVPVKTHTFNIWTEIRDATAVLFQLSLSVAALNSL
jgi:protein involved in polysaccharide export with SLBB domain